MAKKIILGLIITAVISLTSFGAVYAYQKEKINLEKVNANEYGINYSSNGPQAGECSESLNEDGELECPKNKEQIRIRCREEECEDCSQEDALRNEYRYRYENECNENRDQDCEENEKNFQNRNENSNRQDRGRNS